MYSFGHDVMNDPLYPWISETLVDPEVTSRERAVSRLYEKAQLYADAIRKGVG